MDDPGPDAAEKTMRLLVVDDDVYLCETLRGMLREEGYDSVEAHTGKAALDLVADGNVDLVLLDLRLERSSLSGMEVLRRIVKLHPKKPVVILTGEGTIQAAVEATRIGAYDFLEKPVNRERILLTVRNALEKLSLERERDRLLEDAFEPYQMVGRSSVMQEIYRIIERAAEADSKVLISGESGTGKEVVAHAIHRKSRRAAEPFVAVNCAALPEDLIESELFGYEKGAFTGAHQAHKGKFEQANGGTLFLDEIGDMSPATQAKVLRVLETGKVAPLGGKGPRQIDVRLIAATNQNLRAAVQAGTFREDLYFRLNVLQVGLPALRERREDIPVLIEHFLLYFWMEEGLALKQFDREAQARMVHHDWPGNIRELRNVIERVIVLSDDDTITAADVDRALSGAYAPSAPAAPPDGPHPSSVGPLHDALDRFERDYLIKALVAHDWKRQETADTLRINRTYLWRKMQRHQIEEPAAAEHSLSTRGQ